LIILAFAGTALLIGALVLLVTFITA
jgi:hypothetical protein